MKMEDSPLNLWISAR